MTVQTSAGTTIALSAAAPATYDQAGFDALTYTTIGEAIDLGSFGKEFNLVTYNPLGDRKTRKFKGSYNNGSVSVTLAQDDTDAGQVLAIAAADSDSNYSFKVTLQNGDIRYFVAKVMSYTTDVGTVDDITGATLNIEIDDDVLFV